MTEFALELPRLKPPPGGLARLQLALSAKPQPAVAWLAPACATSALSCLVLVVWAMQPPSVAQQALAQLRPRAAISIEGGAAQPLPTSRDDVRLYLVLAQPRPPAGQVR